MSVTFAMSNPSVGLYNKTVSGAAINTVVKENKSIEGEQYGRATLRVEKVFQVGSVRPRVLCLGMVYSDEFSANRGQEFRDRVRLEFLESLGSLSLADSFYSFLTRLLRRIRCFLLGR